MEKLEELSFLQNEVKDLRLQDKLGKQDFHEDMKKIYEPLTDRIKTTSENLTKTISETSFKKNQAKSDLNKKFLGLMSDNVMIFPYLASSLVSLFEPGNKSQFRLIKDLKP